jgi:hypothetical protein
MNEKAFLDAYDLFVGQGYTKSPEEFKKLINENPQALNDSYEIFKTGGYSKSIDDYKALLGVGVEEPSTWDNVVTYAKSLFSSDEEDVKKKEEAASMASPSAISSLASPSGGNFESILSSINEDMIGQDEDNIEDKLGKKLTPYGVKVEQDKRFREAIKLSVGEEGTPDYKEISVPVDNFFGDNDKKSAIDLKKWLAENTNQERIAEQEAVAREFQRATVNEQAFNKALGGINADLISKDEESIVPQLTAMFGNYGIGDNKFKFEEVGATDNIKVTAPNGKVFVTEVDAFTSKGDEKIAADLKKFMDENKPALLKAEDNFNKYATTFLSEKEMEEATKSFSIESENFKSDVNSALLEKNALEKGRGKISPEEYNQRKQALDEKIVGISEKEGQLNANKLMLDKSLANYVDWRSEQGGVVGSIWNSLIGGYGRQASGITGMFGDLALSIAPADVMIKDYKGKFLEQALQNGIDVPSLKMSESEFNKWSQTLPEDVKDGIESRVVDNAKKEFKKEVAFPSGKALVKTLGVNEVTPEYMEKAQKTTVLQSAAMGVAGSLPAIAGSIAGPGGGKLTVAQFALQGYDATMQEMSGEKFENISENEKYLVAVPVAILNGVLEEYGFRNMIGKSGITTSILSSVMGKAGKKATASTFKELVENEVESRVARGALTLGAAGLAEAETGATQQLGELTIKELYNTAKEKELFQTPNGVSGWLDEIGESAKQEAIGGMIMGSIGAVSTAATDNNYNGISDETLQKIEAIRGDETIRKAYVANLKYDIASGKITKEQAQVELDGYNKSISIYEQIPTELSNAAKRKAYGLLKEKSVLEASIQGKDASLVKKQNERINEIKDELTKLPELRDEGVQEASYSINGEQMNEQDFTDAISEMGNYDIQTSDIKATNASEGVTSLLQDVARRVGIPSTPMMETTAPQEKVELSSNKKIGELSEELQNEIDESGLVSQGPIGDMAENKSVGEAIDNKIEYHQLVLERENAQQNPDANVVNENTEAISKLNDLKAKVEQENLAPTADEVAAAKTVAKAEAAAKNKTTKKTKTFDEYSDELKSNFQDLLSNEEGDLKSEEEYIAERQEKRKAKGVLGRLISSKPSTRYIDDIKSRIKMLKNNPEQYIKDEIKKYEEYKAKQGENFDAEGYLNFLKETQSKIQQENAVQEPTTEKGVLRTEQSQVELPTMGEGNAQEATTQEGVAPAKTQEVKPIEQELSELEQMFPTEGPTGENRGVAASNNQAMDEMASRATDERVQKTIKTAQRLMKTLRSLVPTANIYLHENEESYNGAMEEVNGNKNSDGHFAMGFNKDGNFIARIDINLNTANPIVVAHEVAHVVLNKAFGNNQKLFQSFQEKIAKVLSTESNQTLLDFANNPAYQEAGVTYEEYMVQLKALLSEQGTKLELSTAKKIAAVINEYVSRITKGAFKPFQEVTDVKQVVDFVNKVTEAMAKGEGIDVEGAARIGEGSRSSLRDETKNPAKPQEVKGEEIEQITPDKKTAFNKGVEEVINNAKEYKDSIKQRAKEKSNEPVPTLFTKVSKIISDVYGKTKNEPNNEQVKKSYDAMVKETIKQYNFIVSKGLNVVRYLGEGEPYANSQEMLKDLKENKTLKFLPNEFAFGQNPNDVKDNIGLQSSGIKLKDEYELTNSEVFRVVHDYFGHGILGNQFGPIGEENATLQHLDLYSDEAAPAVIFQTRGQNSWVNFSGENARAIELRKQAKELKKQGKEKEAEKLLDEANQIFKFADPKIAIFPNELNFKRYETARRIDEKDRVDSRPNRRANELSKLLETYSKKSRRTRGVNKTSLRKIKKIGLFNVNVISEYTLDDKINENIKKAFPKFKGVQKIYEITNGDSYRKMMEDALVDNPYAASVTIHSPEEFNKMRMFVTEDGSTGITLTKEGFLGGAFSNPKSSLPQNLAQLLILGIKEGATTAEAFDTILPDYYSNFGFKAVSKTDFNDEFKPMVKNGNTLKDWDYETYKDFNDGKPDVVFFIYDGGDRNTIEDRIGLFDLYQNYEKQNVESFDKDGYDSAEEVMKQAAVKRLEFDLEKEGINLKTELTSRSSLRTQAQVDDIVKQARASGYSEKAIEEFLNKRGVDPTIIEKSLGKKEAGTKIVTNEELMPGYDKMMDDVNSEILRGLDRKTNETTIKNNVMKIVEDSEAYKNATDQQREQITRDVKEAFGEKMKSAPSAQKVLGLKENIKQITMALSKYHQQRYEDMEKAEANKEKAIKKASKELVASLKGLVRKGQISTKQMAAVLRKFVKTNVLSKSSVKEFTDYMSKVFADADYANKLSEARTLRKIISKASKNKSLSYDANLVKLAVEFKKIDPAMVEDIDQYNKMASQLKEAIKGSKAIGAKVKFANTVKISEFNDYVEATLESQKEKIIEELRQQVQDLLGIDASTLSYQELIDKLNETGEVDLSKENEEAVRVAVADMFKVYSDAINSMLSSDVDIKESKIELVKRFMKMDISKMKIKDAIYAVDALNNFMVNGSTAKMEKVLNEYEGRQVGDVLLKKKIKADVPKIYRTKWGAERIIRYFQTVPMMIENFFKGAKAEIFERETGIRDLISHKSQAQRIVNIILKNYTDTFYKLKPNKQAFNTAFNNIERNMLAYVTRAKIGKEAESFKDRKSLIEQSIKNLESGTEAQQKKAEIYQQVFDKILKDSKNAQEVMDKVDPINAKAFNYWVDVWSNYYEELADVSENIHNKILGKDMFYTPDKVSRLEPEEQDELGEDMTGSAFHQNSGVVYKKKTGRLEESTLKNKLPDGSYIDLSFDNNNANLLLDALVDIKTAGDVAKLNAFLKSDSFKKVFPNAEIRKVFVSRMNTMVRNFRNKNHFQDNDARALSRFINRIGGLSSAIALTSGFQLLKQTVSVGGNTLINAGIPHFGYRLNKAKFDFINNSGEGIANRGTESQADINAVDSLISQAAESTGEKALQFIEKANKIYLGMVLKHPDIWIAKASWLAYYEKGLRRQGIKTKNLDYSDYKMNKEAAQYAQRMVDRQQNISDSDLKGEFFSSKSTGNVLLSKILFPLASFRINAWSRMNLDLRTIANKTASLQDRKDAIRSLIGGVTESVIFNAIGIWATGTMYGWAMGMIRGADDDDEDKEKQRERDEKYADSILKGRFSQFSNDLFSPLPITDWLAETAIFETLDLIQELKGVKEDERLNIFEPPDIDEPQKMTKYLGAFGISLERLNESKKIIQAAVTGKIKEKKFGQETVKYVDPKDKETLSTIAKIAVLNGLGLLPADANTIQRNIFREISKQASTKTEAELTREKSKKREQRSDNVEKLEIIDRAINEAQDQDVVDELMKMKRETRDKLSPKKMSDEAKEVLEKKRLREEAQYKDLLGGYDTRSDLERYDPDLYEENFGEGTEYYETHKAEVDAKKFYRKIQKQYKDEKYGYEEPPKKRTRRRKNSDGTYKKSSYRYSSN